MPLGDFYETSCSEECERTLQKQLANKCQKYKMAIKSRAVKAKSCTDKKPEENEQEDDSCQDSHKDINMWHTFPLTAEGRKRKSMTE